MVKTLKKQEFNDKRTLRLNKRKNGEYTVKLQGRLVDKPFKKYQSALRLFESIVKEIQKQNKQFALP